MALLCHSEFGSLLRTFAGARRLSTISSSQIAIYALRAGLGYAHGCIMFRYALESTHAYCRSAGRICDGAPQPDLISIPDPMIKVHFLW